MMPPNLTHSLMTPNMTEEFCKYGFNSKKEGDIKWHRENRTMLKRCIKRPGDFFRVKPIRHVNKVKSIGQSHSNSYVLNTAGAYGVVKSEEDNHAVTTAWFIAGDFGGKTSSIPMLGKVPLVGEKLMKMGGKMANFLPGLGFKAGHSYNVSDSHSKRRGFNFSEKITSGQTLGIEQFVLDLNLEVERCVVVSSKRFFNTRLAAERADYISANLIAIDQHSEAEYNYFYPQSDFDLELYICDTKPKAEMFTESWFFIKNNAGIPFAVDGDSPTERRLLKVIRGSQSYRELHRAIKKNSTMALETDNIAFNTPTDILIKTWGHLLDKRFSDEEAAKFLIQNVEGSFPGTIEGSGGQRFDESGIQSF
jgi:hypothetical protein